MSRSSTPAPRPASWATSNSSSRQRPRPTASAAGPDSAALQDGQVFAILRIPRLGGPTWAKPVYEGVGTATLDKGLGRYPTTQLPGQIGNTAIAGHRAGHGNPLIDIDSIRPGDVMIVETRDGYAVYRAERSEIVAPTRTDVIAPVPGRFGAGADPGLPHPDLL